VASGYFVGGSSETGIPLAFGTSLKRFVPSELHGAVIIDFFLAAVDSRCIRPIGGGEASGLNPTDRVPQVKRYHVPVAGQGVPFAVSSTNENARDLQHLLPWIVAIRQGTGASRGLFAGHINGARPRIRYEE
jgi:hypothetical protein